MLGLSSIMLSNFDICSSLITAIPKTSIKSPWIFFPHSLLSQRHNKYSPMSFLHPLVVTSESEAKVNVVQEETKVKWHDIGPDITDSQKHMISQLPPRMSNRCKALLKRIICFSPGDENLSLLLAAWVKVMKPRRCDWLAILKEMKRLGNPLLPEVMEYALLEDSFEPHIRDYTKLIDTHAKHGCIKRAENTFQAMKSRGFPCDQVTLTVLIQMYSKAGDLNGAKEAFEEIQLLGLPLDKRAYGSMIMAYIRAGKLDLAESLMREMEAKEVYAGREVSKALLRAYSTIGDANGAQRVFDAIQLAGIVPDDKLCALLVNAYGLSGRCDEARSVLENVKSIGLRPSDKCVALMLAAYEKENTLEKALAFLTDLEDAGVKIEQEASEVLEQWLQRLGVAGSELQHVLRNLGE